MGLTEHTGESGDLEQISDEQLIRRFCGDPPDAEAGNELARRCLPRLRKSIERLVLRGYLCPLGQDRYAFCEDCISQACEKFLRGVCSFQFLGSFDGWLAKLAKRASLDEYRRVIGRGREPRPQSEPIEKVDMRSGTQVHPLFRSKYWMDPEGLVQERELHETFVILLREHAQGSAHNADSANAIGLSLWESCTAKEIAEKFGCSVARAWKLFSRDYSDLRELLATKYGITEMRHL